MGVSGQGGNLSVSQDPENDNNNAIRNIFSKPFVFAAVAVYCTSTPVPRSPAPEFPGITPIQNCKYHV